MMVAVPQGGTKARPVRLASGKGGWTSRIMVCSPMVAHVARQ
jgi:hypothetical protein